MGLSEDIISNLIGYSKAMYSTWFYFKPDRFLFDAGEGVSTTLGNRIFGIKNIFLSHGHYDHIGGLTGIVLTRNSGMGDKTKALTVFYPNKDNFINILKDYIKKCSAKLTYELTWQALEADEKVLLDEGVPNRFVKTFSTNHIKGSLTLGYNLIEKRTRLKKEFTSLPQEDILKLVKEHGKNHITENYEHILLSYVGDSMPVCPEKVYNAEVLMHEASFIDKKERKYNIHATLEEALEIAREAKVKHLLLYHISSRYKRDKIIKKLSSIIKNHNMSIPVSIFIKDRIKITQLQNENSE